MSRNEDRLNDLIANDAAEHFVAQHDADAPPAAENDLLDWLRRSPVHVAAYLKMAALGKDVARAARHVDIPLERLIVEARAGDNIVDLDRDRTRTLRVRHPERSGYGRRWALAGAAAAVLGVAVFFGSRMLEAPRDFVTMRGEERTWRLDDGTVVHLDSDSAIRVTLDRNRRLVRVDRGQAFFEVAKDSTRPFHVVVDNTLLQDVGTSFDVFRTPAATTVTVVDGLVTIWSSDKRPASPNDALRRLEDLHAGQRARILPGGAIEAVTNINIRRATAWMRHEIAFEQNSIADVAAEFNRYNDLQIKVIDPRVAATAITGVFRTYDLESFIRFLNGLPDVEAVRDAQSGIVVRSRPQPPRR